MVSVGEVMTFRFDSYLPEENYTNNATIQRHPENDETVQQFEDAISEMIFQSDVKGVKVQTVFAEVRLNQVQEVESSKKSEANLTCVRINGFAQLSTGSRSQELINALEHADFIEKGILSSWEVYNIKIKGT